MKAARHCRKKTANGREDGKDEERQPRMDAKTANNGLKTRGPFLIILRYWKGVNIRSNGQVPGAHHIEILITEENPSIVLILQAITACDIQCDLKFL
jgi:hypothetical protein